MDPNSLLTLGRALERLLIVGFSGASLWMGWQLFLRLATSQDQQAEFSFREVIFKLQRVGPGVFFALFGATVLVVSLTNPLILSSRSDNPHSNSPADKGTNEPGSGRSEVSTYYHIGGSQADLDRWITALNSNLTIAEIPPDQQISASDRLLLVETTNPLRELRNVMLARVLGEPAVATWQRWRDAFRVNPAGVPEEIRELVAKVENRVNTTNFEEASR